MTRYHFYVLLILSIVGIVSIQNTKTNDFSIQCSLERLSHTINSQELVIESQEIGLAQAEVKHNQLEKSANNLFDEYCKLLEVLNQMKAYILSLEAQLKSQDELTGRYHYRGRTNRFFNRGTA